MPEKNTKLPLLICSSCLQPRASLKNGLCCGICHNVLCKNCVQFLEDSFFSFLKSVPEELNHTSYCGPCYDQKVMPAREIYSGVMRRARNVYIFERKEKFIPLIKKAKHKENVDNCPDRKETMLRLAFFAAEKSFNAVIEVDLIPKKIRINGYQTTQWSGTGLPALIRVAGLRQQTP